MNSKYISKVSYKSRIDKFDCSESCAENFENIETTGTSAKKGDEK
jgi:hypothetical protein